MNYQTTIRVRGIEEKTLADILPKQGHLKMLIIGKVPALKSVKNGHYFQGRQGQIFLGKLKQYGLLDVPPDTYDDEVLLNHGYGLTDMVKVPRNYGKEPTKQEYIDNFPRIQKVIKTYRPKVVLFVYKGALDQILKLAFSISEKSEYGSNPHLDNLFSTKVFTFPMPGTRYGSVQEAQNMDDLKKAVGA